jgi:3-deoxy-D-manno-octulosonic-acid transferase
VEGRNDWRRKTELKSLSGCIWMHCASLGEFEQGRPILEAIKKSFPEKPLLLTFFSPSGYNQMKNFGGVNFVTYLPLDTSSNAKDFISLVKPELVIFVKYEIWHNFFRELKNQGIRAILISAIFRNDQIYFRKYGGFALSSLRGLDRIFTQNQQSVELLQASGLHNAVSAGDTRFDRVDSIPKNAKEIDIPGSFFENSAFIIIGGSTWPADEKILFRYIQQNAQVKLILAPHEISESRIKSLQSEKNLAVLSNPSKIVSSTKILVIDRIGLLSSLYKLGHIAFIGGGFGAGIHNTLEAAVWGKPVFFGPNYDRFKEARDLISSGAGHVISGYDDFEQKANQLKSNEVLRNEMGLIARTYVEENVGATSKIMEGIKNLLAAS